jgi:hypothetical protein
MRVIMVTRMMRVIRRPHEELDFFDCSQSVFKIYDMHGQVAAIPQNETA